MADDAQMPALEEVQALLAAKVKDVMALGGEVALDARFDEDLHADSLDLVEVVEGVERHLADRGAVVALSDEELLGLRTVGEAAERIHASLDGAGA